MDVLLDKMEESLYELKHRNDFSIEVKSYLVDVEIALARLIGYIEKEEHIYEEDNTTSTSKH